MRGIVGIIGIIIQRTSEPFAYHHPHGLRLTHVEKEQRENIKIMWENRVFSHSKLIVFVLSRLTGHTVAVCMLVVVQDSTKEGDEQLRQKNNTGTRKKKLASTNIKKIKNFENHSINGEGKRCKFTEYKAGYSGRLQYKMFLSQWDVFQPIVYAKNRQTS